MAGRIELSPSSFSPKQPKIRDLNQNKVEPFAATDKSELDLAEGQADILICRGYSRRTESFAGGC